MEIGEFAARHLLELEPEDSATYVLLSNVYAVAGKWDCRDRTRQMMKDRGVKKEPGRSWIELKLVMCKSRYSLWNEIEQEQKDPTVYIHSEKLAVSFGLISLSSTIPLRVIKNLRVCNDCHNWLKFVSRISNRAIVVRDAYRFHHFEGGACSCKDYWKHCGIVLALLLGNEESGC
ncbi:hypothetical protein L1049_009051 [Liquidambar formosana]|uniref:DYW domain-containing protein n=1 Tax=Liquidambar formosana TaxID=63359 RepID=A0AAP0X8P4_LIQFO